MQAYLKRLFSRCEHEYKMIKEIQVWDETMPVQMPIGEKYVLQCSKCGDITIRKTY